MFSLVMFKNSPTTININTNIRGKSKVLSRNKLRSHNMGILGSGLFPQPVNTSNSQINLLDNKTQNNTQNKSQNNIITKKNTIHSPLPSDLLYYQIKSNKQGNIIYTTTNKGIYLSSDYGNNWSLTNAPKKNITYNAIFVSDSGKYIIAGAAKGYFCYKKLIFIIQIIMD